MCHCTMKVAGGHREGGRANARIRVSGLVPRAIRQGPRQKKKITPSFMRRAQAYRHLFDPESGQGPVRSPRTASIRISGWIRPKRDRWKLVCGVLADRRRQHLPVALSKAIRPSTPGFVPHDLPGLAELMGGKEAAIQKVETGNLNWALTSALSPPHGAHSINWIDYENQPATGHGPYLQPPRRALAESILGAPRQGRKPSAISRPTAATTGMKIRARWAHSACLWPLVCSRWTAGAALKPSYELTAPIF